MRNFIPVILKRLEGIYFYVSILDLITGLECFVWGIFEEQTWHND